MANSGGSSGGDPTENSPPQQQPPATEASPRRRTGGANVPASPQRRGGSASPQVARPTAAPPQSPRPRPLMGLPGVSAFNPYNRPPSSGGGSGSRTGTHFTGGFGSGGSQVGAVAVGGRGQGVVAIAGGVRIGGSPMQRKRVRESGGGGAAAGGQKGYQGGAINLTCSICRRTFATSKALFGHMRSHPNRGWTGAHPPPAFRAEEEFADVPGLNRPAIAQEAAPAAGGGGAEEDQAGGGAAAAGPEEEADESRDYKVPDLNATPPSTDTD